MRTVSSSATVFLLKSRLMMTFCDGQKRAPLLKALAASQVPHSEKRLFRFNNSAIYESNKANKIGEEFWRICYTSMQEVLYFDQIEFGDAYQIFAIFVVFWRNRWLASSLCGRDSSSMNSAIDWI